MAKSQRVIVDLEFEENVSNEKAIELVEHVLNYTTHGSVQRPKTELLQYQWAYLVNDFKVRPVTEFKG